jgi:CheY-like chemotaxis protein
MVVEDEPELLKIFVRWLTQAGCNIVRSARDGEEALPLLRATHFDLLISDINMPRMDGITLVRNLAEAGCSVPTIIFVSGEKQNSDELRQLGVRAFLSKPIRRTELLTASQNTLAERMRNDTGTERCEESPGLDG